MDSLQPFPPSIARCNSKHATAAAAVFKEHGALRVVECCGDDVPQGKLTSFPKAVKCKDDETVVYSWITCPSRQVRDDPFFISITLHDDRRPVTVSDTYAVENAVASDVYAIDRACA